MNDTDLQSSASTVSPETVAQTLAELEAAVNDGSILNEVDQTTLQQIEAEIEMDEVKANHYASGQAGNEAALNADENAPAAETKQAKTRTPRTIYATKGDALIGKIGREQIVMDKSDLSLDQASRDAKIDGFVAEVNATAKKVQEKVVNIFAAAAGKAKLSEFTKIGLRVLTKGTATSKEIYEAMTDPVNGYSVGTSRSQSQQVMHLLAMTGVATRSGKDLALNQNSVLFEALKASV